MARGVDEADSPLGASLLAPLDKYLRLRQAIYEFSDNPECLFRVQELRLEENVTLSDGATFKSGERVLDLHLWNEHIPRLEAGPLRWALRLSQYLRLSLGELAAYLKQRPDLSDIVAIRANLGFGTREQTAQLMRLSRHYGFEPAIMLRNATIGERLHRFGENILIAFLILAWNKSAIRRDVLRRSRIQVFLPRAILDRRYEGTASSRPAPSVTLAARA